MRSAREAEIIDDLANGLELLRTCAAALRADVVEDEDIQAIGFTLGEACTRLCGVHDRLQRDHEHPT